MKIYIFADQEGVAGVYSRTEGYLNATEYGTMELVAICEALLDNGVDEILLNTIHIVEYHKFPSCVRIFHGMPVYDWISHGLDGSFDAALVVGMHEMAGGREKGCWRHTILPHPITRAYSSVEAAWLNDIPIGEFGLFAAFAGMHDMPVTLMTGDHWGCVEAAELVPGIETVAVKEGRSYFSAISLTPQAAAKASAAGAVRSLAKIGEIKPIKIEGAVTLKVRYAYAERAADALKGVPNSYQLDERTVAASYRDMKEFRHNFGCIRAPELEAYTRDTGYDHVTGFFTRFGPEPYDPS